MNTKSVNRYFKPINVLDNSQRVFTRILPLLLRNHHYCYYSYYNTKTIITVLNIILTTNQNLICLESRQSEVFLVDYSHSTLQLLPN